MPASIRQYTVDGLDDVQVVAIIGDLDLDSAAQLREALAGLVERGVTRIVVDLGDLRFCDSTGLSVLITTQLRCRRDGGFLRLAAPGPAMRRLLAVVGVADHVTAFETVRAAASADLSQQLRPYA
ncbi:STAS domain-containing protein [Hamadaea tsunoensis]|uniref:STAS domain-containing protein n=1 Tax=Hamadaea tsunoensis TaxID=53368 RepID=UPI001FE23553|nr:STAS domain-containing protein [Hamadaea tsunoensis]